MLQKMVLRFRQALWVIPALYIIASLCAAVVMIYLDNHYTGVLQHMVAPQLFTGVELAEVLLGVLANSFLTMIFIFTSAVMVVLSSYLGEYTQRTIQNYLSDPMTLNVLGIFSGGFLYSVVLLLLLDETDTNQQLLAPATGVVVSIVALMIFIYFLYHAGKSIQLSSVLRNLSRETIMSMEENDQANLKRVKRTISQRERNMLQKQSMPVTAPRSGYVQLIDFEGLTNYAAAVGAMVRIEKKVGDYITDNQVLFSVWSDGGSEVDKHDIYKFITLGEDRASMQDVEYALQKMVEVTLKGLSLNDPNTAIFCIHEIGRILNRMARTSLFAQYYYDRSKQLRLVIQTQQFSDVMYFTFYQIRHYARDDLSVLAALLDAMTIIAEGNDSQVKQLVWNFCSYVLQGFNQAVMLQLDEQFIFSKVEHLAQLTGFTDKVDSMWSDYLCG